MASILNADNGVISGSAGLKMSSDTSGILNLQTNGTTAISISASQVVSFGATSSIDFSGSVSLSGGTANGVMYLNGSKAVTTGSALTFDGTALASTGSGTQSITATSSATAAYIQTTGAGVVNARLQSNSSTAQVGTLSNHNLIIQTNSNNVATFDTSGNLGIGTSSPNNKLQVNGSIVDNASGGYSQFTPTGFGALVGAYGSNNTANLWLSGGTGNNGNQVGHYINSVMAGNGGGGGTASLQIGQLAWSGTAFTSGTAQLTLDSSGNLGLGVTPSAWGSGDTILQIKAGSSSGALWGRNSTLRMLSNVYYDGTNYRYIANGTATSFETNTSGGYNWNIAPSGTAGNAISFTQAMTLNASGYLGVGTTSPWGYLHVNGAYSTPQVLVSQVSGGNNGLFLHAQGSSGSINWLIGQQRTLTGFEITPSTAAGGTTFSTPAFVIDTSSNVGIGTITPSQKLQVAGNIQISANSLVGNIQPAHANYGTRYWDFGSKADGTTFSGIRIQQTWDGTYNDEEVQFYTHDGGVSAGQRVTIDKSGNLLVGGTSAGSGGTNQYTAGSLLLGGGVITAGYKYVVINYSSGGSGSGISFQKAGAEKAAMFFNDSDSRLYVFNTGSTTGVYMAANATSWTANSDERLKTDLKPIENAANKISTLRAVTGRFKSDEEGTSRAFLIAQDVQAVLPEAVDASDPDKLGVTYTDTIPLLVAAIKELTTRVAQLESK